MRCHLTPYIAWPQHPEADDNIYIYVYIALLDTQSSEGDSYADLCKTEVDGVTCVAFGPTALWGNDFDTYKVKSFSLRCALHTKIAKYSGTHGKECSWAVDLSFRKRLSLVISGGMPHIVQIKCSVRRASYSWVFILVYPTNTLK